MMKVNQGPTDSWRIGPGREKGICRQITSYSRLTPLLASHGRVAPGLSSDQVIIVKDCSQQYLVYLVVFEITTLGQD